MSQTTAVTTTAPTTPVADKARLFHRLHLGPTILVLPNAWDAVSARLIEAAGFPAVATTSAGIAYSQGHPDLNRMTRDDMLTVLGRIAPAVAVPVTADIETGFGDTPEEVAETVRRVIGLGIVGANIEDGSLDPAQPLLDAERVADRIRAAREVADGLGIEFVINGRFDGYLVGGRGPEVFRDAVRRLTLYREAGARCLYAPMLNDRDIIQDLVRAIDGPLNILANAATPPAAELQAMGVARVTTGGSLARAAFGFIRRTLGDLRDRGAFAALAQAIPANEMNRLSDR